jgi:hypothetical protein
MKFGNCNITVVTSPKNYGTKKNHLNNYAGNQITKPAFSILNPTLLRPKKVQYFGLS